MCLRARQIARGLKSTNCERKQNTHRCRILPVSLENAFAIKRRLFHRKGARPIRCTKKDCLLDTYRGWILPASLEKLVRSTKGTLFSPHARAKIKIHHCLLHYKRRGAQPSMRRQQSRALIADQSHFFPSLKYPLCCLTGEGAIVLARRARAKQADITINTVCFLRYLSNLVGVLDNWKSAARSDTHTLSNLRGVASSTTGRAPLVQRHARQNKAHIAVRCPLSLQLAGAAALFQRHARAHISSLLF